MAEWDTLEFLADVRARGSIPDEDGNFTTAEILKAATLELREGIAPLLVRCRTEHLVYPYEVAVSAGTASYRMPVRAMGGSLRDVFYLSDASSTRPPLGEISADDPRAYSTQQGTPEFYFLRNYAVNLVPVPSSTGILRMPYYARPNKLVLPEECAVVTEAFYSATTGNNEVLAQEPPDTLRTDAMAIEIVRGTPGFETLFNAETSVVEELSPGVWHYIFTTTSNPNVSPGDYICLPGASPVPQAPVETHGLLAARTAMRLLKAAGDDRWQYLKDDVAELEDAVVALISSRVASHMEQPGGLLFNNPLIS